MEILLDNDVIISIARYALWSEFDRLLRANGAGRPYRCLGSAVFVIQRAKPPCKMFADVTSQQAAVAIVRACSPLPGPTDAALVQRLLKPGAIDTGEALLIEYAVSHPAAIIITGDKRCIVGLASDPAHGTTCQALAGRFVQFDRVIHSMCEQHGWAGVRGKVCGDPTRDPTLAKAFASTESESSARAYVDTRITALKKQAGGLLRASF